MINYLELLKKHLFCKVKFFNKYIKGANENIFRN